MPTLHSKSADTSMVCCHWLRTVISSFFPWRVPASNTSSKFISPCNQWVRQKPNLYLPKMSVFPDIPVNDIIILPVSRSENLAASLTPLCPGTHRAPNSFGVWFHLAKPASPGPLPTILQATISILCHFSCLLPSHLTWTSLAQVILYFILVTLLRCWDLALHMPPTCSKTFLSPPEPTDQC